jgi:hypothetical protein
VVTTHPHLARFKKE